MGPFHTSNSTAFFSYCIHSSTEGSESRSSYCHSHSCHSRSLLLPQPLLPLQQHRRIKIQIQLLPQPHPFPLLFVSPLHPQSLQQLVAAKSLMILASTFMFDISYGA